MIQVSSFHKESIYLGEIVAHDCERENQMMDNMTEVFRYLLLLFLVPLHLNVLIELGHRFFIVFLLNEVKRAQVLETITRCTAGIFCFGIVDTHQ